MNAPANPQAKRHIGQFLIDQGILTEDQLRIALLEQTKQHVPVGRLLVQLGFVSEATLRDALSEKLGLQSVDLGRIIVDPSALKMLPRDMARRYRVFPVALDRQQKKFIVALSDTNNIVAIDQLRAHLKGEFEVELRLAGDTEIERAIEHYYGHEFSIDGILKEIETGEVDYTTIVDGDEYSQPVVRLISALFADAVERGASDIHFEPEQSFLRIRYRIDGVLRQIRSLHKTYWPAMAVRLKVMAKMNIAETRAPQDGRISATLSGRVVDFRVASLPTTHGENLVLRILDRQKGIVPLDKLGLEESQLEMLKRMIARPEGIILVTGPTGSGKTTTLYSILNHINADGINIMTLEDPVEYPMTLIRQTSVAEAAKLDFANGVRAMMRQDPDVILVGEVRDRETAEMAFRAAMTGHQVYSTLHTNSAVGAFPRLLDIGIVPDILAGNIIGILAQRLVRKLCRTCRQSYDPDVRERRLLGVTPTEPMALFRAVGCEQCDYQGYRGRQSILELLKIDAGIDELVARRATAREILTAARASGFKTLADDGVRLVRAGTTGLEALNLFDLEQRLARMELDLVTGAPSSQRTRFLGGRVARQDLINFCFHLEQLATAGVPVMEGLVDLRESVENPRFREVVSGLVESIEGGRSLSQALAEFPEVFSKVFVSLVRSGEQTGKLPAVLKSLTETLKWEDELAAQTKKLMIYPAFVGGIVMLVTFFLMIYLVPQMTGFIRNMGQDIPLQTRLLIAVSDFFVGYWWAVIAAPFVAWAGLKLAVRRNPALEYVIDHYKLAMPLIGPILRKIILSRFASSFAMMYASGITVLDAIRSCEEILGNKPLEQALHSAGQQIAEGKNLTAAFQDLGVFPPLVIRMMRIGETTGALDTALLNVSYFFNREVKESIGKVQAMIEPALTLVLGAILGWVMLSVLGPVYDTMSKMKF